MHKTGIVIQARMASSRLKGKVLLPLPINGGNTILEHIVARASKSDSNAEIVVATSTNAENIQIKTLIEASCGNCKVFRGSEDNVLERYYLIAQKYQLKTIVRLTGDNPIIDPFYVQMAIESHKSIQADYTHTVGLPLGMNVEIMSFKSLEDAYMKAKKAEEKEHVTPFLISHPEIYKHNTINIDTEEELMKLRLTVDNPSDYALVCLLYDSLYDNDNFFGYKEIRKLLNKHSWLREINQGNFQKKIAYLSLQDELEHACQILSKNGFTFAPNALRITANLNKKLED
jgi:spore coat polysaccharide biosynthesis protein SpsF